MRQILRFASLLPILALVPLTVLWVARSEMTHLWWMVPVTAVLTTVLFGLWYLVFGGAPFGARLRRLGLAALALFCAGIAAAILLRYEGSTSGSSFPKFSWRWQPGNADAPLPSDSLPSPPADTAPLDLANLSAELPGFLGEDRDGIRESPSFGTDWSARPPELLWRRAIGKGWSSFAVTGGNALTQEQNGDDEQVTCLDLATGRTLWAHVDPDVRLLLERAENGGAAMGGDGPRATPSVHEGKVYTMGATGLVHCLDLETGSEIWSRHLLRDLGAIAQRWGMASSPLILTDPPVVVFTGPDHPGPTLLACDLETGETRWTYEGSGGSYASPRLVTIGGVSQVLSVNGKDVSGIDPATGTALWTHPWPGNFPKVGQPILLPGDRLLVTASYGVGSLLLEINREPDGSFKTEQLWKTTYLKTKFSSAAVLGEHAYGLDEGRLACISMADGKRVWKKEKFGFGQHLLFGDRLLVQAESGEVVIGSLHPEGFRETGRIPALSSMTWNTPAVAGRILLVRNDREAAAFLLPAP